MKYLTAAFVTAIAFLVIDIVWITLFVTDVYSKYVGDWLRDDPNVVSATLFYLAYVAGIVFFAIRPALTAGGTRTALLNGALLGALAYGTYTLTNHAVFELWSWELVISDILWGAFLTGSCAAIGFLSIRKHAK